MLPVRNQPRRFIPGQAPLSDGDIFRLRALRDH
jgi:hypothetical protein